MIPRDAILRTVSETLAMKRCGSSGAAFIEAMRAAAATGNSRTRAWEAETGCPARQTSRQCDVLSGETTGANCLAVACRDTQTAFRKEGRLRHDWCNITLHRTRVPASKGRDAQNRVSFSRLTRRGSLDESSSERMMQSGIAMQLLLLTLITWVTGVSAAVKMTRDSHGNLDIEFQTGNTSLQHVSLDSLL